MTTDNERKVIRYVAGEPVYAPVEPPPPEPEPPPEVPEPTGWKPDFTKPDPWEGMPQEYVEREAAAFKPTEEAPLPPSQQTEEGRAAREKAPEASREFAAIRDLSDPEDYEKFEKLQDEEKFVKAMELGLIPEGSEFAPGLKITYAPEIPVEERILKPREWGYYTAEQVAEKEKAEAEAKIAYEARVVGIEAARKAIADRIARETAEFETKLKDMPVEFQNAYREDGVEGYNKYVEAYNKKLQATHTQLPDEQWISNEQLARLETEIPEAHRILTEHGFDSYTTYMGINYIELPDGQLIKVTDADALLTQSRHGYDILRRQGYKAYQEAVDKALEDVKPFERPFGYNTRMAAAQGMSLDTLSLIFPPEDVEKVRLFYREPAAAPLEDIPEEIRPVSGLPPELIATLPAIGAVAIAEPTFIGEVIVGTVILGAATYAVAQNKDINWGALWNEITDTFKKETGKDPTPTEATEMETVAAKVIGASALPVIGMPKIVATKAYETPPWRPGAIPIITMPQMVVTKAMEPVPWKPPIIPEIKPIVPPPVPIYEAPPWRPPTIPVIEMPKIVMAQAAVATAEKELDDIYVIIKPKILKPGEFLPATVPKTETALLALDEAVGEAYAAGEIDADTLRVYSQARTNLLTKKGLLDAASKAYIGGIQPELVDITQELASSAFILALSDLQEQANKAAIEAYNEALAKGMTQAQAVTAAQTAAQNTVQTAAETAIQQAVETATQTAVQIATQTLTKTAAKTATQTLTSTATQTAVQTAVNTAVATATATMTQTATTTATGVVPIIPLPRLPEPSKFKRTGKVEPGTIEWRQGLFWRYLEPPDYKPLRTSKTPLPGTYKFAVGEDSAYKTIQVLNGVPPRDITDIDIGIAIVDIRRKGKELTIHFKQDVEDIYKGKEVKEPIQTFRRPDAGLKYHTDESGKLVIDQEPKKRTRKPEPKPIPVETLAPRRLEIPEPTRKERPEKEPVLVGDRYYLGKKLPDSNIRVEL